MEIAEIEKSCREIKARRKAHSVTVDDLHRCAKVDTAIRGMQNQGHPDAIRLRTILDNLTDSFDGAIQSRLDSHYWDRGLLELESDGRPIVYVADGCVLAKSMDDDGNDVLESIPPEEVRIIGDAPPD